MTRHMYPDGHRRRRCWSVATQFQRHTLNPRRRLLHHTHADFGRTGERDFADERVRHQRVPGHAARSSNHIQHTFGQPSFQNQIRQRQRTERNALAGFTMTVLPIASAGADLPSGDHQREVPGDDQRTHAQRFAEGHHRTVSIAGMVCP